MNDRTGGRNEVLSSGSVSCWLLENEEQLRKNKTDNLTFR